MVWREGPCLYRTFFEGTWGEYLRYIELVKDLTCQCGCSYTHLSICLPAKPITPDYPVRAITTIEGSEEQMDMFLTLWLKTKRQRKLDYRLDDRHIRSDVAAWLRDTMGIETFRALARHSLRELRLFPWPKPEWYISILRALCDLQLSLRRAPLAEVREEMDKQLRDPEITRGLFQSLGLSRDGNDKTAEEPPSSPPGSSHQ